MEGFFALARKELLEQRRTWRFVGTTAVFVATALLVILIPLIVTEVQGDLRTADDARALLIIYGITMSTLGVLVAIMVAMGLLANERSTGTAGMTLSKPVTRAAFVAVKHIGLGATLFLALFLASAVAYVLCLAFYGDPGFPRYIGFMAVVGVWILFTGSITLFWSAVFRRQLVASGVSVVLYMVQLPLTAIPHTERYWPVNTPNWASGFLNTDSIDFGSMETAWPALIISLAGIIALGVCAWAVFRKKEL